MRLSRHIPDLNRAVERLSSSQQETLRRRVEKERQEQERARMHLTQQTKSFAIGSLHIEHKLTPEERKARREKNKVRRQKIAVDKPWMATAKAKRKEKRKAA